MSSYVVSGPDLVPTGVTPGSMGAQAPNPLMEQAQTVLNAGFNSNIASTRNTRQGNPRAIGHYSGNEAELGIVQREPCFVQRGVYDATGTSSRVGAFTSFNGLKLTGIQNEMDYYKAFTYVGISLGATYVNGKMDPNSQQGVATAMTGSWSMPKNYGKKTIHVGDVVRMKLPPLDSVKLQQELARRQTGEDFPFASKVVATPEPVNPADVVEFWRRSARSLIDENFSANGQPNPAFDLRDNLFQLGASYTNRNSAQDTMTVQLKQLAAFFGVTFAMHLIDYGLVIPITLDSANPANSVKAGSSQLARQGLLAAMDKVTMSKPEKTTLVNTGDAITDQLTGATNEQDLKTARDDFKRLLMGISGLVREDGGPVENRKFTRMYHMRILGSASGDGRHASLANQITNNSLITPTRAISLMSQYQSGSSSAADQYRQIQSIAFESFMRKSGEVFDFLYKNCAGRAMSNSPEGTVLHGVR